MTSLLPSRSTATISCAPQFENHRRPSCQRGDSPTTRPVISACSSDMDVSSCNESEPGGVPGPLHIQMDRAQIDNSVGLREDLLEEREVAEMEAGTDRCGRGVAYHPPQFSA